MPGKNAAQHNPRTDSVPARLTISPHKILDAAPDAMLVTDRSGVMVLVNRMTEALFGYPRDELVGQTVEMLVPIRLRDLHREHRDKYSENPAIRPMGVALTLFGLRKDGGEFPVEVSLSPLFSGSHFYVIVAVRDMTERRRLESALWRAERMASLGNLAAGIAHEINGPVGAALLTAESALTSEFMEGPPKRIAACLRNIVSAMERCGKIVQNILKFSRNDPGDKFRCNLNERVWRVKDLLEPYAAERRATIQFTFRETLPSIWANPLEIEMLIGNLTRNAIESKEEGANVEIRTNFTESLVELNVSDDGHGMPEAQVSHIFEPFFTTRQNAGGTGLGLSIVYRIAQLHGASIEVDSVPRAGTTVRVNFPRLNDADQPDDGVVPAVRPNPAVAANGQRPEEPR
jgi:two-component system sensor kinase FixL